MFVQRLTLKNFRNLQDGEFFPCKEGNVIYGDNAQGKTNLLEALWLFTGGHSFRGAKDSELPRLDREKDVNAPNASLSLDFFSEGRDQNAVLQIDNGRRSSVINGVKKKTGSALVGKVRAVIFSPEHLLLIKEGPARRRAFLDGALCQLRPGFATALGMYQRVMLQRNALLKDMNKFPELADTLEVWDMRLAHLGAQVIAERKSYIDRLCPKAAAVYEGISHGKETLSVKYSPTVKSSVENLTVSETEEMFLKELKRTLSSDIRFGFTSIGPHRDDLEITLNGISARTYGSQGQQRSAVLALKLTEAETLAESSEEPPIVLLDDVMSELDQSRQDYLLNNLSDRQVFITCCSPETVSLQKTGKRFCVTGGVIRAEEVS